MINKEIGHAILELFVCSARKLRELRPTHPTHSYVREVWLLVQHRESSPWQPHRDNFDILVGPAPGGAYRHLGYMEIQQETLIMWLRHPKRVMFRKSIPDTTHVFALGDPDFFKTVGEFIEKAAFNETRAEEISFKRSNRKRQSRGTYAV